MSRNLDPADFPFVTDQLDQVSAAAHAGNWADFEQRLSMLGAEVPGFREEILRSIGGVT